MVLVDDRILEALDEEGFQTPSDLADLEYIHYSAQYVGDRARELAQYGLVENVGNGVYRITESGVAYLQGNLNTSKEDTKGGNKSKDGTTAEGTI